MIGVLILMLATIWWLVERLAHALSRMLGVAPPPGSFPVPNRRKEQSPHPEALAGRFAS